MDRGNRGVFWLIDGKIFAVPYDADASFGISKSGDNYNHRLLWDYVKPKGCNKPYDYYPRGRVEQSNKGNNTKADVELPNLTAKHRLFFGETIKKCTK